MTVTLVLLTLVINEERFVRQGYRYNEIT